MVHIDVEQGGQTVRVFPDGTAYILVKGSNEIRKLSPGDPVHRGALLQVEVQLRQELAVRKRQQAEREAGAQGELPGMPPPVPRKHDDAS